MLLAAFESGALLVEGRVSRTFSHSNDNLLFLVCVCVCNMLLIEHLRFSINK